MTSKYKVGDKVRVKSLDDLKSIATTISNDGDLTYSINGWVFSNSMSCTCGNTYIIGEVRHDNISYYMKDSNFLFEDWMLEDIAVDSGKGSNKTSFSDKHYDFTYTLTEKDIQNGKIKLYPYFVSQQWKIGSKDDSGAIWHIFKTCARFGEKNDKEREIRAINASIKRLAEIHNIEL